MLFRSSRIFWLFALTHLVLWTVVPSLSRYELDTDSMMHFAWGQEWMGSYRLHPPVLPWLIGGFFKIAPINNWTYNLLTQLTFLAAFYCIWRIAREVLPPYQAVAAVCLLEFIPYFSFFSMRLNHSSLLIPMWAATVLLAYLAIQRGQYRYWVGLGLFSALAMLTKYYSAALLPGIALYLLLFPEGRATLKTAGPYLALITFLSLMGWHVWYVFAHNMGTISHVGDYIGTDFSTRLSGLRFLGAQTLYLAPLVLIFFLSRWRHPAGGTQELPSPATATGSRNTRFIYWMFWFPLLGSAIVGFIAGIDLSSRWGGPTLNLAGIVLLLIASGSFTQRAAKRLFWAVGGWVVAIPSVLLLSGLASYDREMYHFPGKELGQEITKRWRERFERPLKFVGGGASAPNSIAFHSPDHPSVLQHLSTVWSPWIQPSDIEREGIAIVCVAADSRCTSNTAKLFPGSGMAPLTVKAQPRIFFPGSEREFLYL